MYLIYKEIVSTYNSSDKKKQDSYYLVYLIYRHLSFPIAALFIYLGISANITTVIGATVMLSAGISFVFIDEISIYLPVFLYWLAWTLDFADGTIARYNHASNYFGKIIDGFVDYLSILIFLPIAYGNIQAGGSIFTGINEFYFAMIGVVSRHAAMYYSMRIDYFRMEIKSGGGGFSEVPVTSFSRVNSIKNVVSYIRGNTIVAAPVVLLVAIIFNAISYYIVSYAIFYLVFFCIDIVYKSISAHSLSNSRRSL